MKNLKKIAILASIYKALHKIEVQNSGVPYLRKLVRAKMIPHYKFGNRIKFDIKEINEWVENNKVEMKKSILLY